MVWEWERDFDDAFSWYKIVYFTDNYDKARKVFEEIPHKDGQTKSIDYLMLTTESS